VIVIVSDKSWISYNFDSKEFTGHIPKKTPGPGLKFELEVVKREERR